MSLPPPERRMVIPFGYLWQEEHAVGRDEPAKEDRPCLILDVQQNNRTEEYRAIVLPLTHTPQEPGKGFEIPQDVQDALKLDQDGSWVVTSEANTVPWPRDPTPDLRPLPSGPREGDFVLGYMPPGLFQKAAQEVRENVQEREFDNVQREGSETAHSQSRENAAEVQKQLDDAFAARKAEVELESRQSAEEQIHETSQESLRGGATRDEYER